MKSPPVRLLFVCSRNQWRSPTAESLYRRDPRCEVRSAGTASSARRRASERDLAWADMVVVMESHHRAALRQRFGRELVGEVRVLDVADEYEHMDPTLVELLETSIEALLDELLT